ncbi:winged helix-turn-helix domain-containing protein [Streptomyces sp. SID3343]|uniref:ArsR/SmtB family transcription factor n=1 Tax=Streptomyces sp. SID3343 TaxID=2690260 RepID=UPI00137079B2|nr:winged helix-turn-helix domain-containing protein [Streptomyces sp. SID3343]MYW01139.1 helix-turn-helix domain-containing protein [Streptomyces sp. SID3343]
MLRIHFTARDLAGVAFAHHTALPISEAVMSLQVLRQSSVPLFRAWRRYVLERLPPHASLLGSLVPAAGWVPDFLTPSAPAFPGAGAFEAIRATPRERLTTDVRRLSAHRRPAAWVRQLADGDKEALDVVADTLAAYNDVAITPFADPMRAVLDADRAWRVETMARAGVGAVLAGLHPQVHWHEPVLELPALPGQGDIDFHLEGRGLLLCGHVFCGLRPRALLNDVDTPVLIYPPLRDLSANGLVSEPPRPRENAPKALTTLLGRTRAAVLHALAGPGGHTTTQLARHLGISPASASEHAAALRAAGLIVSLRQANTVLHTATALGTTLLATTHHSPA